MARTGLLVTGRVAGAGTAPLHAATGATETPGQPTRPVRSRSTTAVFLGSGDSADLMAHWDLALLYRNRPVRDIARDIFQMERVTLRFVKDLQQKYLLGPAHPDAVGDT